MKKTDTMNATAPAPISKRDFLKRVGLGGTAVMAAPYVMGASKATIKWRLQTYAGAALGMHVIKPAIEAFNKIANGEMKIEVYYADQLIPTSELYLALHRVVVRLHAIDRAVGRCLLYTSPSPRDQA
eukprot:TRINITY_DN2848_c0_g1_i3.p5 TRINITY_DN2848_c0_g1~~TRINITY_DN2848_c0_g1_i3.p5  ORF type:complete len:127 (-),score=7.05 TRINITY_DN2848_c0_g1_i3:107-487(-)